MVGAYGRGKFGKRGRQQYVVTLEARADRPGDPVAHVEGPYELRTAHPAAPGVARQHLGLDGRLVHGAAVRLGEAVDPGHQVRRPQPGVGEDELLPAHPEVHAGGFDPVAERLQQAGGGQGGLVYGRFHGASVPGGGEQPDVQPPRVAGALLGVRAPGRCREVGIAALGAVDQVEERRAVAHGPAEGAVHRQAVEDLVGVRTHGDAAAGGLEPEQPRTGRRDADRAGRVGGVREGVMPAATAAAEPPLEPPASGRGPRGCGSLR
ncbi:hypothetical protein GCM10020254_04240 [Streptomyces goshikiensis]